MLTEDVEELHLSCSMQGISEDLSIGRDRLWSIIFGWYSVWSECWMGCTGFVWSMTMAAWVEQALSDSVELCFSLETGLFCIILLLIAAVWGEKMYCYCDIKIVFEFWFELLTSFSYLSRNVCRELILCTFSFAVLVWWSITSVAIATWDRKVKSLLIYYFTFSELRIR